MKYSKKGDPSFWQDTGIEAYERVWYKVFGLLASLEECEPLDGRLAYEKMMMDYVGNVLRFVRDVLASETNDVVSEFSLTVLADVVRDLARVEKSGQDLESLCLDGISMYESEVLARISRI